MGEDLLYLPPAAAIQMVITNLIPTGLTGLILSPPSTTLAITITVSITATLKAARATTLTELWSMPTFSTRTRLCRRILLRYLPPGSKCPAPIIRRGLPDWRGPQKVILFAYL